MNHERTILIREPTGRKKGERHQAMGTTTTTTTTTTTQRQSARANETERKGNQVTLFRKNQQLDPRASWMYYTTTQAVQYLS